jgi:nitrogen regulatory protein PII
MMKLLFITYDADFDEDVMEMLNSLGVTGFTKWDSVLGKGQKGEPRLDDPVWPGFNCAVAAVISDDDQVRILENLKKYCLQRDGKGFKVFVLPVITVI